MVAIIADPATKPCAKVKRLSEEQHSSDLE